MLSPILFNTYVNVVLECGRKSGHECRVGKVFTGCLVYPDDVHLTSTVDTLEHVLSICEKYFAEFIIKFNAPKSKLLVFSKNITGVQVKFQGNVIPQVESVTTVGHYISNSSKTQQIRVNQAGKNINWSVQSTLISAWVLFTISADRLRNIGEKII